MISCAKLGESDVAFWKEFDVILLNIMGKLKLKNLATLSHGLTNRLENGVSTDPELTGKFLKAFIRQANLTGSKSNKVHFSELTA